MPLFDWIRRWKVRRQFSARVTPQVVEDALLSIDSATPDTAVRDIGASLRFAIQEARREGLEQAAADLEEAATAAYTTSSEMLGEIKLAIDRFLESTKGRLPDRVEGILRATLVVISEVWPSRIRS
jgi:hypothetical protein